MDDHLDRRLHDVLSSVFGLEDRRFSDNDSPETIDAWDSVAHINLIMALEAEFEFQFDPAEIAELDSVGRIRRRIDDLQPE